MQTVNTAHIGKIIALLRTARNLTQKQLARAAGVSATIISQFEQGRRHDPAWSTIQRLALALDVSPTSFQTLMKASGN